MREEGSVKRPIDWHVHCWLPGHRSPEDVALQQRRNVAGDGQAEPERLRAAVDEAGLDRFVIVSLAGFRRINDWGAGVTMPRIPEETIEAIMHERPLSVLGIEPAPANA